MDALFGRAAALRRVELVPPRNVIGKSTVESIQSGVIYGFSGQIDAIVDRFVAEIGECTVVATGGLAELLMPFSRTHPAPRAVAHAARTAHHLRAQPDLTARALVRDAEAGAGADEQWSAAILDGRPGGGACAF